MVGKDYISLKQDIYTVKRDNRLMISFSDFCMATDLAISVNSTQGTAGGWFIREDQTFSLDAQKREVTIMGKTTQIDPKDISIDGNEILVSSTELEKWFSFSFDYI